MTLLLNTAVDDAAVTTGEMTAFILSCQSQNHCQSHIEVTVHWLNCLSQLEKVLRISRSTNVLC
jgi:hypothetical protein